MDPRLFSLADEIFTGAETAAQTFDDILQDRISDSIEARKVELAASLFNQPVEAEDE